MVRKPADLSPELAEAFTRFWTAYPRRPGNPRAQAEHEFAAAVKRGVTPEVLIGAAGRYAADVKARGLDPQYVCHARTWLHQRRWEDWLEEAPHPEPVEGGGEAVSQDPLFDALLRAGADRRDLVGWLHRVAIAPEPGRVVVRCSSAFDRDQVSVRLKPAIEKAYGKRAEVVLR